VNILSKYFLSSILFTLFLTFTHHAYAATKQQKQTELKALQKQIKKLQNTIAVKQDSKNQYIKQLKKSEKNIGRLNTQIKTTNQSISDSNKRIKKLNVQRKQLSQSLTINTASLENQIYDAYIQGSNSQLQMIFNQEEPAQFQRHLMFYQYVTQQQSVIIDAVNNDLRALDTTSIQIHEEKNRLSNTQQTLVLQKKSLVTDQAKRQKIINRLNTQLKKQGKHLKALNEDEKQLKQLISSINEIFKHATLPQKAFKNLKGKLPWPLTGKLKTMYGHLKPLSHLKWQGNVIYAKEGKHVRAISSGIVAYADWLKGFGNLIILNHGDGYLSLYSHNQSLYKAPGESVSKGEIISSAGNSGGIKKSGVYFEIRKKGKPKNPAIWCNSKNTFSS